jgi:hypothetical protein
MRPDCFQIELTREVKGIDRPEMLSRDSAGQLDCCLLCLITQTRAIVQRTHPWVVFYFEISPAKYF